ncbi:hypothetical protein JL720_7848 [Aureococcus anophagefferens]|nr:hypothetical protein JL720_7848 [Aureococcus anophagefferens]
MTVELGRDDTSTRRHLVRAVFLAYQCPDDIRELLGEGPADDPGPLRIEVTRRDDDGYDYDVKVVGMGRIFSPKVLRDFQKLRLRAAHAMGVPVAHAARCLINPMMFVGLFGGLAPFREEGAVDEFLARGERHEGVVDDAAAAWGEALAAERDGSPEDDGPGGPKPHIYSLSRANDADKLVDHVKQRLKREEKDLASLQEGDGDFRMKADRVAMLQRFVAIFQYKGADPPDQLFPSPSSRRAPSTARIVALPTVVEDGGSRPRRPTSSPSGALSALSCPLKDARPRAPRS